jgi:hypothetical protein
VYGGDAGWAEKVASGRWGGIQGRKSCNRDARGVGFKEWVLGGYRQSEGWYEWLMTLVM